MTIPIDAAGANGATAGDYTLSANSVTIDSGDTSDTFTVTAVDDSVDDDGESVNLSFGTLPDEVSPGTQSTATVNLTDDDHPQVKVEFGAASYTATEGGTAATVTVNLSADPERSVTIPITAAGAGGAGTGDCAPRHAAWDTRLNREKFGGDFWANRPTLKRKPKRETACR